MKKIEKSIEKCKKAYDAFKEDYKEIEGKTPIVKYTELTPFISIYQ